MTDQGNSKPPVDYVVTPFLEQLIHRALTYLNAGLSVHLQGPAGVGKTSLAVHLAGCLKRPVYTIYGNEAFRGLDLAGRAAGHRARLIVDNYVPRVMKRTEEEETVWSDSRLLRAVRQGGTVIYDEFTRSRPEANNLLLSVLEEGVLELPFARNGTAVVPVHPDFRVIFTSNPDEYAGVYKNMDALFDRMVTLDLGGRDLETDIAIVAGRAGIKESDAARLIRAVQHYMAAAGKDRNLSLRPALMVARVVKSAGIGIAPGTAPFDQVCEDIVGKARGVE